jgi:acetylornithine deacetylase/succinyl-diaminopimelate desuccinylase-like protein
VRLPIGVTLDEVKTALEARIAPMQGVRWRILQAYEPLYTDPTHEIVARTIDVATEVLGRAPVANMRIGASDARLYRMAGVPSVVFGCTPFNMGGPDENVLVDELVAVACVHTLVAFDFLSNP